MNSTRETCKHCGESLEPGREQARGVCDSCERTTLNK